LPADTASRSAEQWGYFHVRGQVQRGATVVVLQGLIRPRLQQELGHPSVAGGGGIDQAECAAGMLTNPFDPGIDQPTDGRQGFSEAGCPRRVIADTCSYIDIPFAD
jgi:hypothetical protein